MIVTDTQRTKFDFHVLVNKPHRFVFFTIPKVACTQWIQLFRRLQSAEDWRSDPHYKDDRPFFSSLTTQQCAEILNDPSWTKAVFFRDPVERLISAYLDKFIHRKSYVIKQSGFDNGAPSFEEFLEFVLNPNTNASQRKGLHKGTNPHWRPQSLVANVGEFIEHMNFIGRFNHLHTDAKKHFTQLDLWDEFGATGWGVNGDNSMFEVNDAKHKTNARKKIDDFVSPSQLQALTLAYQQDYELFDSLGLTEFTPAY